MKNNPVPWKRVLTGGALSALAAVISYGLLLLLDTSLIPFVLGVALPLIFFGGSLGFLDFPIMIGFWFLIGLAITGLVRKDKLAIAVWFGVYSVFSLFIVLFSSLT